MKSRCIRFCVRLGGAWVGSLFSALCTIGWCAGEFSVFGIVHLFGRYVGGFSVFGFIVHLFGRCVGGFSVFGFVDLCTCTSILQRYYMYDTDHS